MCRERAALAKKEMEYWLSEAEEWNRLRGTSDPSRLKFPVQLDLCAALNVQGANEGKWDWSNVPEVRQDGEDMAEQQFKLEVPAQVKEVAEKTIDQAESSFHAFIEAASKSVSQNMKNAFDHAKKLLHAADLQEAMRLQSELLKMQYEAATEQLKEVGNSIRSSSAEASKRSVEIK
jgi:Phasin protein